MRQQFPNGCKCAAAGLKLHRDEHAACCAECRGCGWFLGFKLALGLVTLAARPGADPGQRRGRVDQLVVLSRGTCTANSSWCTHLAVHGVYSFKDRFEIRKSGGFFNSFSVLALSVETLPVAGTSFFFANAAGAALHAAEHEPALRHLAAHPGS